MIDSFPVKLNVRLTAVVLVAVSLQLFAVPLVLLPQAPGWAFAAAVTLSLVTPLMRALMHEAIYNRLATGRRLNDVLGRALAVTSGIALDPIRFGHLTHHRFARHELDRPDVIEPGKSRVVACATYYLGLLGGMHVREMAASLAMLLPKSALLFLAEHGVPKDDSLRVLRGAIRRTLDRRLRRARTDLFLAALIYALAFYLYGAWWPVLVAAVAVRALIVSLQDNAAHYGTPAVLRAPAHNARLARFARTFMLNGNLHGVHHERPELPWTALPQVPRATEDLTVGYLALIMRQLKGPRRAFYQNAQAAGAAAQD